MAFIKETTLKGLPVPNAYYKIMSIIIDETGEDQSGKIYRVGTMINSYTDQTKEFELEQKNYYLENFREEELNLTSIYTKLITEIEEFKGVKNV